MSKPYVDPAVARWEKKLAALRVAQSTLRRPESLVEGSWLSIPVMLSSGQNEYWVREPIPLPGTRRVVTMKTKWDDSA